MVHRRESANGDAPMREELAQLRADIDSLVGTVGRLADSAGHELAAGAKRTLSEAQAHADDAFGRAWAEGRRTLRATEKTIKAHPFASLAIAAGLGLLLGRLIAGRD